MSQPVDPRLEHARAYVARGWPVFVLGRDKRPLANCTACRRADFTHDREACECLVCHGFYAATLDLERVKTMLLLHDGLLAVRTGRPSGLVVIDFESSSDEPGEPTGLEVAEQWEAWTDGTTLLETRRCRTGSNGLHLYYAYPRDGSRVRSRNRVLPSVDVKSDGGYVAVPCGLDGRHYENDLEPTPLPDDLVAWLGRRRTPGEQRAGGQGHRVVGYSFERALSEGPRPGERDEFFNDLLFRRRVAGVERDAALAETWDVWSALPQDPRDPWPWEWIEYKADRIWLTVPVNPGAALTPSYVSWLDRLKVATSNADSAADGGSEPPVARSGPAFAEPAPPFETELSETGNQHRFVRRFAGRLLFVPGIGWHIWDGVAWRLDDVDDVFDMTQDVLVMLREEQARHEAADEDQANRIRAWYQVTSSMRSRRAILAGAQADPRLKVAVDSLNVDPYQLVVRNGTLDLRTGKLQSSRPEDHNTQVAAVAYDESATCPEWLRHVELVTRTKTGASDPAMAAFIQRWAGYTLTGLVSEQKFFFGYGGGNNGKNVFIETLLGIMGTYAIRGSAQLLTGSGKEHETIIADLATMRMVFIDETPHGRVNEARIKALTGSSKIRARRIKQDSFEFDARFKMWIAGNNKPVVADTTKGFWRRLDLVPFDVTIRNVIPGYADVLRDEWSGVLNWCLAGLQDYLRLGGLAEPERVLAASAEYRDEENAFGQFIEEYFEVDGTHEWTPNNVLHWAYKQWAETQGVRTVPSMQRLANDWRQAGFERDDKPRTIKQGTSPAQRWATQRGWMGPRLRNVGPELRWEGMYDLSALRV